MAVPPPPTFEEYGRDVFAAPPRKPTLEQRGAAADVGKKEVETEKVERTLPTTVQTNQAPEGYMWKDPSNPKLGVDPIPGFKKTDKSISQQERKARIKASLAALQRVRELAGERLAIGSASEFLQNVPLLNQNRRNIVAAIENAQSGIISDVLERLAEINQGGVTGLANTAPEAQRMGAQIANLDPNQDLQSLLTQAQLAENYYLRQAAALEGKEAADQDLLKLYLPENRLLELAATDPQQVALNAESKTVPVPDWYQQAVTRYLNENGADLDPSQYAAMRMELDERAGFTTSGTFESYVEDGTRLREGIRKGAKVGPVPPPSVPTSALENAMTSFAQNPIGAGVLSAVTSATAGIPVALTGRQEEMEAVRQNQPVASFIGDVIGGAIGTKGLGTTTRIAGFGDNILANPVLQDAAFNVVSGATQAEDPIMGATSGLVSSLIGEYAGRTLGRAMPGTFAPSSMRTARESVPTSGELGEQADILYRRAAAQGQMVDTPEVETFIDDTEQFLRANGFIDQNGGILGTGPVQDAYRLLSSFRGRTISPAEAQTLRNKIAEGRMAMRDGAPDNTARMFSGQLTDRFDDFAETAMPGIAEAREVAQRRIIGRELQRTRELGQARGDINYSQGGADLGLRRAFGNLDTAEIRGTRMYPQAVSDAIEVVSRGTPARNVAQGFGRLSPQGGTGLGAGLGLGGLLGYTAGDAAMGGILTGTMYGAGLTGRALASAGTRRDAELAELIARGGPAFQSMLDSATEEAALRAGRLGAGAFGAAGIRPFMDEDFREETPTSIALDDLSAKYPEQPPKAVPPAEEGFTNVTAAGDEVAPAEAPKPKAGDTIVVDNRDAVYDPVAKAYIFKDTGEIARKAMQRGGMVKGYKGGGLLEYLPDAEDVKGFGRSVAEGAMLGYNDNTEAYLRTLFDKDPEAYKRELARIRREQIKYKQDHPVFAGIGEGVGMVGTAFVPGMQGLSAARVAQMGPKARAAYELALATGQGAAYGGGTMYDDPDSKRDPLAVFVSETAAGTLGYPASRAAVAGGRALGRRVPQGAKDFVARKGRELAGSLSVRRPVRR